MRVLIVEENAALGGLWERHLKRLGYDVDRAANQVEAIGVLQATTIDIIVLDLILNEGSAFAIADFCSYRQPDAKVIFVTNSTFFSDGSIFQHVPNACAMVPSGTSAEDIGALVAHYGQS